MEQSNLVDRLREQADVVKPIDGKWAKVAAEKALGRGVQTRWGKHGGGRLWKQTGSKISDADWGMLMKLVLFYYWCSGIKENDEFEALGLRRVHGSINKHPGFESFVSGNDQGPPEKISSVVDRVWGGWLWPEDVPTTFNQHLYMHCTVIAQHALEGSKASTGAGI